MLDFLMITTTSTKRNTVEVYPKFIIKKSKDLMIRGGDFYAVWNENTKLWSTEEEDLIAMVDAELRRYTEDLKEKTDDRVCTLYMWDSSSGVIDKWHKYCQKQMRDNYHPLDETLIFANTETTKESYATKKLPYALEEGSYGSYDKLIGTLYNSAERQKLEWAIGSIVTGDSKTIQKFVVLYGAAGTGKSTVLNIIQQLFDGYYSVFDARALGSSSNSFALEAFKTNPLVAIQHDGDLSHIEDNTRLNSLVSHELMTVNEKFKSTYTNRFNAFLFMGTNKPVKITDGKSGLLRRLIDVSPSGAKLPPKEYHKLYANVKFELGAIAYHCKTVYESDPGLYDTYIPTNMMGASNDFYNFVADSYFVFKREDAITLKSAWEMYRTYCDESKVPYPYSKRVFKEELKNYFWEYQETYNLPNGEKVRGYFSKFKADLIFMGDDSSTVEPEEEETIWLNFNATESIFDKTCSDCPAQYANDNGTPIKKWDNVTTKLSDLNTTKLHYVKVPVNHIVIDFDIPDNDGNKNFDLNFTEAAKWPATYAELSKSGQGIHLHYVYTGDPSRLSRIYKENIEIKVFSGKSSLRRMLTKCNDLPIATISSGLPLKGEKKMVNFDTVRTEKKLRALLKKGLCKEVHPNTKPSVDFIKHVLDEYYNAGVHYDVTDMQNAIVVFAAGSTHQSEYCMDQVASMHFKSDDEPVSVNSKSDKIVFYDVEVFPNLFLVNWKLQGKENPVLRMINPSSSDIEMLLKYRLVGFNCRRYDNHILYGRLMNYTNEMLYQLSQDIISGKRNAMFGEAYNLSYTDVYDFASKKQSLKKWEIELGIHHHELGLPWDQPVPEDMWIQVAEYCDDDVLATEAVFDHLQGDFIAREILAVLAGGTVNDTTNSLTTKFIFGNERNPQLVYTDLSTGVASDPQYQRDDVINAFPGYEYTYSNEDNKWHNMYRGTDLGRGGYIVGRPGIYHNVALLDVRSLHPTSAVCMNYFGKYTQRFKDILDARIAIKQGDYDKVRHMFDGALAPYLEDESTAEQLAYALKIAINSVYGLTSASFNNPFKDSRNVNNIVALRGALFMRTLQDEVEKRGFIVAAIRTDSIKIPEATPEIIQFCMDFAEKYGYFFEHEATYEKMALVNKSAYIAKYSTDEKINGKHAGKWTATATQFQVPYVFKTLFSKEPLTFDDFCETKEVKSGSDIYLDFNEDLPVNKDVRKELEWRYKNKNDDSEAIIFKNPTFKNVSTQELEEIDSKSHNYSFVGRIGLFTPMKSHHGAGTLLRTSKTKDGRTKYDAVTGTKGYLWVESENIRNAPDMQEFIDDSYYKNLVDEAVHDISELGDFEAFVADDAN